MKTLLVLLLTDYQPNPGPNTVNTAALQSGAVTSSKLASGVGAVPVPTLTLEQFGGAAGDSSPTGRSNNNTAWTNLFAAISGGARIALNAGNYYFAGPVHTTKQVVIEGVSGGGYNPVTNLFFPPATCRGVILDYSITSSQHTQVHDLGVEHDQNLATWQSSHSYAANAAIMPTQWQGYVEVNLGGTCTSGGSEPTNWPTNLLTPGTTDGQTTSDNTCTWTAKLCPLIDVRETAHLEYVSAQNAYGDGVRWFGNTTDSIADEGSAINLWLVNNLSSGIFVTGSDANNDFYANVVSDLNGTWGVYDNGALANTWVNPDTSYNGSQKWFAGQVLSGLTRTSPTVRNGYDYTSSSGTAGMTEPTWPTTVGVTVSDGSITWTCARHYSGGPFFNRTSSVFGLYAEVGQQSIWNGLASAGHSATMIGGVPGPGFDPLSSGFHQLGYDTTFTNIINPNTGHKSYINGPGSYLWQFDTDGAGTGNYTFDYYPANGNWEFRYLNLGSDSAIGMTTGASVIPAGGMAVPGAAVLRNGFYVGNPYFYQIADAPGSIGSYSDWYFRDLNNATTLTTNGGVLSWIKVGTGAAWANGIEWLRQINTIVTTPRQILDHEAKQVFSNFSTPAEITFNLPGYGFEGSGIIYGEEIDFVVEDSHGLKIVANDRSDVIDFGGQISATNGYIESTTVGSTVKMIFTRFTDTGVNNVGTWLVWAHEGVWSMDGHAIIPPGIEMKLSTTVIDCSISTKQTMFTVPSGEHSIITKLVLRSPTATLSTASLPFGYNSTADDVITTGTFTGMTSAQANVTPVSATVPFGAPSAVFGTKLTATQSTTSLTIDVFGYLF